jgi:hypothetical protein
MSAPAGWYPDTGNQHVTRYWDGTQWTKELHWDGNAWVDPHRLPPPPAAYRAPEPDPVPVTPAAYRAPEPDPVTAATPPAATPPVATPPLPTPPVATPPLATPSPPPVATPSPPPAAAPPVSYPGTQLASPAPVRPTPGVDFWLFAGGSVGVALSAFLPWVSVSGLGATISSRPGTGGPAVLLLFAAGVLALAWPTISSSTLSLGRRIGLLPVVGFLALCVLTNWSDLSDLKDKYDGTGFGGLSVDAGVGFYLYTLCVIVLVVALVRVWLAARARPLASSELG